MKKLLLLTFLISSFAYSQTTTKDGIQISIKKSKLVDNASVFGIRQLKITTDKLRKVMIKAKIKSNASNKTKLSAFSLLDTKNNIRYRLADYKGYRGIIGYPELIPRLKTELFDKKGKPLEFAPIFDKTEKDYFNVFNIKGYRNLEIPINFGTKEVPNLSIVYFGETRYEKYTAELFFPLLVENINLDYVLFYKNEKISDIKFSQNN